MPPYSIANSSHNLINSPIIPIMENMKPIMVILESQHGIKRSPPREWEGEERREGGGAFPPREKSSEAKRRRSESDGVIYVYSRI